MCSSTSSTPVLRRSIVWSMQRLDPFELSLDITLQMLRRQFPPVDFPGPGGDGGARHPRSSPGRARGHWSASAAGRPGVPATRANASGVAPGAASSGTDRVVVDPLRVYQSALQVSLTDALLLGGGAAGRHAPGGRLAQPGGAGRHGPGRGATAGFASRRAISSRSATVASLSTRSANGSRRPASRGARARHGAPGPGSGSAEPGLSKRGGPAL